MLYVPFIAALQDRYYYCHFANEKIGSEKLSNLLKVIQSVSGCGREKAFCACSVMSDSLWPPQSVACQGPLSMGFSLKEYWSRLPFSPPGDLPNPGIETTSLHWQAGSLLLSHQGTTLFFLTGQVECWYLPACLEIWFRLCNCFLADAFGWKWHKSFPGLIISRFCFPYQDSRGIG